MQQDDPGQGGWLIPGKKVPALVIRSMPSMVTTVGASGSIMGVGVMNTVAVAVGSGVGIADGVAVGEGWVVAVGFICVGDGTAVWAGMGSGVLVTSSAVDSAPYQLAMVKMRRRRKSRR
jgi:hypothetical protein